MIRHGGDGGTELQAQLAILGMAADQISGVVKDIGGQGIDGILGHIVAGQDHSGHGHGGHILVQTVHILGDHGLGVVIGGLQQLGDMLVVQADQMHVLGGGQIGDSSGGSAGHDEGGVDLAVLQGVSPTPFFVVICMAASASFSTPIGYQTNLIVQGIGNYKFMDFVRIGLPLNIITFLISVILIPMIWNF